MQKASPHHLLVPQSGTDYHPQQYTGSISPLSGNSFLGHMYPQLRCFAACSGFHYKGPAPRNPQLILNLLAFVGAGLRRDAIASYVCYGSLWLSSNKSQFTFVVLSPLRYENLFFMSSCQKYTFFMSSCQKYLFFMSSCQKYTSSCPPRKYRTKSKKLLQNKN